MAEKTRPGTKDAPDNIPDLMNSYRDLVTARVAPGVTDQEKIKTVIAALARQCVQDGFVPREISRQDALDIAGTGEDGVKMLKRLEESHLIRTASITENVSFALDSLAEYLSAQDVVREFQGDETRWRALLSRADELTLAGGPLQIRGFLAALNDCCRHTSVRDIVPRTVPDELLKRMGSDSPTHARRMVDRRIGCYAAALESEDAGTRKNALTGLGQIGPVARSAVPFLIPILSDPDSEMRYAALKTLADIDLTSEPAIRAIGSLLSDSDSGVQHEAAWILRFDAENILPALDALIDALGGAEGDKGLVCDALGKAGLSAVRAKPALEKILEDSSPKINDSLRLSAAIALWKITQQADRILPLLQKMLQLDDIRLRDSAGKFVNDLGDSFSELAPALLRLCQDPNAGTRATAARLLCRNAGRAHSQVLEFEELLPQETEPVIRIWEATALWRIGVRDSEQVQIITEVLLHSPSSEARALAANILGQMEEPARSRPALQEALLKDTKDEVRLAVTLALEELKVESALYVPVLTEIANTSPDSGLRTSALEGLGKIKPVSREILAAMIKALDDENGLVRDRALLTLRGTSSWEPEVIQAYTRVCQRDSNNNRRGWAAEALGRLGKKSMAALPVLRELLHVEDIGVRISAAGALWEIESITNGALQLLTEALLQANEWARKSALEVLARMGAAATPAIPVMIEAIKDPNKMVRRAALESIGAVGPAAGAATAAVIEAISDKDDLTSHAALKTLPRISIIGVALTPSLIACLASSRTAMIRRDAAELIGEIGPPAARAVPELVRLLVEPDELCRQSAAQALGQMKGEAAEAISPLMEARLHVRRIETNPIVAEMIESLWRSAIETSIVAIAPNVSDGVASVREYLGKVPHSAVTVVIEILGKIGSKAAVAVPELIALSDDPADAAVCSAVARALAAIGDRNPETIVALNRMLAPGNPTEVRAAAANAHAALRAANTETIAILRAGLRDQNDGLRLIYAESLWSIEQKKDTVLPVIEEALRSPESSVRSSALTLAEKIGPEARELAPAIRSFTEGQNEEEQLAAGMALWSIGGETRVVTLLRKRLMSAENWERMEATTIVAKLGPAAREAEPELKAAVTDGIRGSLAALAGLHQDAVSKIEVLVPGLQRSESGIREEAADALGAMGPVAAPALPDLEKATYDAVKAVRMAAKQAIRSIQIGDLIETHRA